MRRLLGYILFFAGLLWLLVGLMMLSRELSIATFGVIVIPALACSAVGFVLQRPKPRESSASKETA
jgi:membrane-bound ClpP family serine protease